MNPDTENTKILLSLAVVVSMLSTFVMQLKIQ